MAFTRQGLSYTQTVNLHPIICFIYLHWACVCVLNLQERSAEEVARDTHA